MLKRQRNMKHYYALGLMIALLAFLPAALAQTGWVTDGENTCYYETDGGSPVTGLQWIDGGYYCFDENGIMQTGFISDTDGSIRYFGPDGKVVSGWFEIEGNTYHSESRSGELSVGHVGILENGQTDFYYFDEQGIMQTGFIPMEDVIFYFGDDGKRVEGWFEVDGNTYYSSIYLYTGRQTITEGKKEYEYYFDETGKMMTGMQDIPDMFGKYYTYYFDDKGRMVEGWVTIDGAKYYFGPTKYRNGLKFFGDDDEIAYLFDEDGKLHEKSEVVMTYVRNRGDVYVYVQKDGSIFMNGWKTVDGKTYYFDEDGFALIGQIYIDDDSDDEYYFNEKGELQRDCMVKCKDGKWWYVDKDGIIYYPEADEYVPLETRYIPPEADNIAIEALIGFTKESFIQCEPGSYAEKYALSKGIQYDNGKKKVMGYQITDVNRKADWIIANYIRKDMSEREKALVLHNWLIFNSYAANTISEHSIEGALIKGYGVCDSYAKAYELLLTKAGIANKFMTGVASGGMGTGGHAWNLVRIDGQWYHVDVMWDDPLSPPNWTTISGAERQQYFLMTDKQIGKNHTWDKSISADKNQVGEFNDNGDAAEYFTDKAGVKYRLNDGKTAAVVLVKKNAKKLDIPDTIKVGKTTYRVTAVQETGDLSSLEEVNIGKNVTSLPEGVFSKCKKLKKVSGGAGLTEIPASAFEKCTSLTSITIYENVKKIGEKAFSGCGKLEKVTIKTKKLKKNTVGNAAFEGIAGDAAVICPAGKLSAYKKFLVKKGMTESMTFKKAK